jgi:plasmid stabilization system protein ParE
MSKVVWSPTASRDIEKHYNFLLTQDATTATKAVQKIIQTGGSLAQSPYRGTMVRSSLGLRKLLVSFGKYGYVIHYAVIEEEVVILRVYHGRENRPN